jgi:hypothetical protein
LFTYGSAEVIRMLRRPGSGRLGWRAKAAAASASCAASVAAAAGSPAGEDGRPTPSSRAAACEGRLGGRLWS